MRYVKLLNKMKKTQKLFALFYIKEKASASEFWLCYQQAWASSSQKNDLNRWAYLYNKMSGDPDRLSFMDANTREKIIHLASLQ